MNILLVSSEVAPFAKVGGLADVAASLPKELRKQGHDVRIVMPLYEMVDKEPRWHLDTITESLPVPLSGIWLEHASVKTAESSGVPVYFIGHERYFQSATSSDKIYTPGIEQYLFFSAACLELPGVLDWTPDVVHCNDWQTGFVPVLMREKMGSRFDETGAIFTIHNLAYQGEFGPEVLDALALPRSLFVPEHLETWGAVNFLKAGCVYSDRVTTVSPNYAKQIQTPEYGCKLEGLMGHLAEHGRLSGILNGIDTEMFDPATDPFLPVHFSAAQPEGKALCREALLNEVGLKPIPGGVLAGAVTRLSHQKGLDLLAQAAPKLFELGVQLIIQGLGDPNIVKLLQELQKAYPHHLRFLEKFDEDLAQRIYAGCDLFAMPSLFEPCGLGQMIAMRYGTLPVVRATGGLADTVFEGENGFVFGEANEEELIDAFRRALAAYRKPETWTHLVTQAMKGDFGWDLSAREYVSLYKAAVAGRKGEVLKLA